MTFDSDEYTIRSVLDTLTSCCMQMAEILQSGEGNEDVTAANQLASLLKKSKKEASLPTADQVEFWKSPEKDGWMYSQGEHIKTWRKRWFVLKQGFLFRFASPEVGPTSKPRGIVDLSQVADVTDGSNATGRPLSIKISTSNGGSKCYIVESETAQVEWISALEGAVAKILKIVAGLDDDEDDVKDRKKQQESGSRSLEQQLRDSLKTAVNASSSYGRDGAGDIGASTSRSGLQANAPKTINIINYNNSDQGVPRPSTSSQHSAASAFVTPSYEPQAAAYYSSHHPEVSEPYVNIDYAGVAGAKEVPTDMYPTSAPQMPFQYNQPVYDQSTNYSSNIAAQNGGPHGQYNNSAEQGHQMPYIQPSEPVGAAYAPQMTGYSEPKLYHGQYSQGQQDYPAQNTGHYAESMRTQPMPEAQTTLLDTVTSVSADAPHVPPSLWQTHHTQDGRPYYYNTVTGITQWEPPEA